MLVKNFKPDIRRNLITHKTKLTVIGYILMKVTLFMRKF